MLICYHQLLSMEDDIPPDGGSHSQPVDIQAATGNPFDRKV